MTADDLAGFFATRDAIDPEQYLELDFTFECVGDPREAAAHLCAEQSTAQWRRVGVDEDFRPRFAAKVLELDARPLPKGFSITLADPPHGAVHVCRATIAHPHGNFGARLPNLLSAICGEGVFFVPGIPLVRLEDIRFPAAFLAQFDGPQFGIAGLREQLQLFDRPFFFGVIKPNIGLPPESFATLGYESWIGGLDIAKDDEMLADVPWCSLAERTALLGAARRQAEAATGVPKMYLANITDDVDRVVALHDVAVAQGANAVLVNAIPIGLSGVRMLALPHAAAEAQAIALALREVLEEPGKTAALVTPDRHPAFDLAVRVGHKRVLSSATEFHRVTAPTHRALGMLRIAPGRDVVRTLLEGRPFAESQIMNLDSVGLLTLILVLLASPFTHAHFSWTLVFLPLLCLAIAIPTLVAMPCPNGPVVVSTPETR